MVPVHPPRKTDRLPLPGPEPAGSRSLHHLVRRSRGGADRRQLATPTQARLGRALLPRRRALHADGDDTARSHALRAREGRRPRLRRQADARPLLGLATQHHLGRLARRDADGARRRRRVRAEDGRHRQGAHDLLWRGRGRRRRRARSFQLRRDLQAARGLRRREQRLCHLDPFPQGVRHRLCSAARGGVWVSGGDRRRTRPGHLLHRREGGDSARPCGRRPDAHRMSGRPPGRPLLRGRPAPLPDPGRDRNARRKRLPRALQEATSRRGHPDREAGRGVRGGGQRGSHQSHQGGHGFRGPGSRGRADERVCDRGAEGDRARRRRRNRGHEHGRGAPFVSRRGDGARRAGHGPGRGRRQERWRVPRDRRAARSLRRGARYRLSARRVIDRRRRLGPCHSGQAACGRDAVRRLRAHGVQLDHERDREVPLPQRRRLVGAAGRARADGRARARRALSLTVDRSAIRHARVEDRGPIDTL